MPLYHAYNALTNTRGDSLVGFRVQARIPNGGAVVPIYSDISGTPIVTVSGYVNQAVTDDAGNYSFFIEANANYDLEYYTPDGVFVSATRNVPLFSGIKGDTGDTGLAANTFTVLATFKAADVTQFKSAYLSGVPGVVDGPFTWVPGDTTAEDGANVFTSTFSGAPVGRWKRQGADGIALQVEGGVVIGAQQKVRRQSVNLEDYRRSTDGPGWYAPLRRALGATKRRIQLNDLYDIETGIDFGVLRAADGTIRRDVVVEGWGFETGLRFTKAADATTTDIDRTLFRMGNSVPDANGYKQAPKFRNLSILGNGQGEAEAANGAIGTRALTVGRMTTQAGNGYSGSNSFQIGFDCELEADSSFENVQIARFERGFKTKLGYGARFVGVHSRYNLIGFDITRAVTCLDFISCTIERNGFGAFFWISSDCRFLGNNIFQANYAGADVNVFIGNQGHIFLGTYFEGSPRGFVVNGGSSDPAQFMNVGFDIRGCKALKFEAIEYADGFNIENNRMASSAATTPPANPGETGPSLYLSDTNVTNMRVGRNVSNDDPRQLFTNYTGPGVNRASFTDRPFQFRQAYTAAPNVPNGGSDSFNVSVPGVRKGQFYDISVTHTGLPAGWEQSGTIFADDVVRVNLRNFTGGPDGSFTGILAVDAQRK